MSRIQEVLSANKNRVYPFVDDSYTGVVPDWMLLDLKVMDAGNRGTDVRLVGAKVETGVGGKYTVDLTIPGVDGAVFTVEVDTAPNPVSTQPVSTRIVDVTGLGDSVVWDRTFISVDSEYWGEIGMVYTAAGAEESRGDIEAQGLAMPTPSDFDSAGYCHNFFLRNDPSRDGASGLSRWCGCTVKSPRTVTLLFKYGTVDFSVPVKIGSGVVVGKATPASDLSIRYAVYGGGSEYPFGVVDGNYGISSRIVPSNVTSLSKDMYLSGITGTGGTAAGVIHVRDGYNTTAHVYGNTVHVEVGSGIGLGAYCPEEPTRIDCYYYDGKIYEDVQHATEITGVSGVVYDDVLTGRSYKWNGESFEVTYDAFDCSKAFMFLNGQHANTSGNINIVGGPGVSVQTGRTIVVDGKHLPAITIKSAEVVDELLGSVYLWKKPEDETYEPTGFPVGLQIVRSYDGIVKYRGVLSEDNGTYSFAPSRGFQAADVEEATGQTGHLRLTWGVDTSVDEYSMELPVPGTNVSVFARFGNLQTNPTQAVTAVAGLPGATFNGTSIYVPNAVEGEDPVLWGSLNDLETRQTAPSGLPDTKFDRFGYCHNFELVVDSTTTPVTTDTTDWVDFVVVPEDVLEIEVTDVETGDEEEDTTKKFEVTALTIDGDDALLQYGVEWAEPNTWEDPAGS